MVGTAARGGASEISPPLHPSSQRSPETRAPDQVAKAVDWDRVFQIQGEYLRVSLERTMQLTQRYLEVSQAVVTQAASVARREAKKAAA